MADDESVDEAPTRSRRTSALWTDVQIDPIEIALPGGVGYTLRAYRPAGDVADGEAADPDLDDFDAASAAVLRRRRATEDNDEPEAVDSEDEADLDEDDDDLEDEDEDEEDDEDDEDEDEDAAAAAAEVAASEDIPVFLGAKGRVYLFHSQEKLVEFVKSGAEHDLSQLETWSDLVGRVRTDDIDPLAEDRYELDLVVENLRGGPDAWDPTLILKAGELARDLGYALRMETVIIALSPGSPLDDLDEALRRTDAGGVGSFFAKRKLRKIPAQQSSLAWRTVIGKISAVADWRD